MNYHIDEIESLQELTIKAKGFTDLERADAEITSTFPHIVTILWEDKESDKEKGGEERSRTSLEVLDF